MADIFSELHAFVTDLHQSFVGLRKGLIEISCLSHHRKNAAACGLQNAIKGVARPSMKQLKLLMLYNVRLLKQVKEFQVIFRSHTMMVLRQRVLLSTQYQQ